MLSKIEREVKQFALFSYFQPLPYSITTFLHLHFFRRIKKLHFCPFTRSLLLFAVITHGLHGYHRSVEESCATRAWQKRVCVLAFNSFFLVCVYVFVYLDMCIDSEKIACKASVCVFVCMRVCVSCKRICEC